MKSYYLNIPISIFLKIEFGCLIQKQIEKMGQSYEEGQNTLF
jgi:hypothetical protein